MGVRWNIVAVFTFEWQSLAKPYYLTASILLVVHLEGYLLCKSYHCSNVQNLPRRPLRDHQLTQIKLDCSCVCHSRSLTEMIPSQHVQIVELMCFSMDWCRPSHLSEDNERLMQQYPAPFGSDFRVSPVLLEPTLTADNYRARMHDLLYVEEIAQYATISRSALWYMWTSIPLHVCIHIFVDFSSFLIEVDWSKMKLLVWFLQHQISWVSEWLSDWVRDFSSWTSSAVEAAKETKIGTNVA